MDQVQQVLSILRCSDNEISRLRKLIEEKRKERIFPDLLDENGSCYFLTQMEEKPTIEYEQEDLSSTGKFDTTRTVLNIEREKKRENARLRKRKSRAKVVVKME